MKKFYVSAIYTSPYWSMGGNTKILIEIINNLNHKFKFIVFTTEPLTFKDNLKMTKNIKIVKIKYPFKKFNYLSHLSEIKYITRQYKKYFTKHKLTKEDYFFSQSDFAPDVVPVAKLKDKYKFIWITSLFLFIPNPFENLLNNYKFPFFKYIIYYFYQRYIFSKIVAKGDLFLITNDYDRKYFPQKFKNRIFAIYGGVNPEQIEEARKHWKGNKIYDAVYCSRLHPQKGISGILDIWRMVLEKKPNAKLAIIGNGEKSYEEFLKDKAKNLRIDKNIKWFGYINGVEKYKIYLQSKIFLHGTIYDNNGMVAAEALCTGLPVIMYDLPQLKEIYNYGCIKIGSNNKSEYAEKVIDLLSFNKYVRLKNDKKLLKYWDWKQRVSLFLEFSCSS